MTHKLYLALYDEQKLISDFLQFNLERFHQYDVLFSADTEEKLFKNLTTEVRLLLFYGAENNDRLIVLIKEILTKFDKIKILIYSRDAENIRQLMTTHTSRLKVVSIFDSGVEFLGAIKDLLPEHPNHRTTELEKRDYNSTGFEKIRHNRKWILILSMIAKGMKPKEISALTALKHETINSYIEQMIKETGCGNISEVLLQSGKRNIL